MPKPPPMGDWPAEGRRIETARLEIRPRLSQRKAGALAGISDTRWRHITTGKQPAGEVEIPVVGPSDTVARMAKVVGVTPEQLEADGRADAADELRDLLSSSAATPFRPVKHADMRSMLTEAEEASERIAARDGVRAIAYLAERDVVTFDPTTSTQDLALAGIAILAELAGRAEEAGAATSDRSTRNQDDDDARAATEYPLRAVAREGELPPDPFPANDEGA